MALKEAPSHTVMDHSPAPGDCRAVSSAGPQTVHGHWPRACLAVLSPHLLCSSCHEMPPGCRKSCICEHLTHLTCPAGASENGNAMHQSVSSALMLCMSRFSSRRRSTKPIFSIQARSSGRNCTRVFAILWFGCDRFRSFEIAIFSLLL